MHPDSLYVDLLGCEIYQHEGRKYTTRVIEAGSGPALIMMHGGGGHAEAYSRNFARLSRRFRVMSVDFIWHGLSSKPPFRHGNWLEQFTEQILDLMDSMGIAKASFEGESLGGWVAMDLGIRFPERVDKLILNTAWGGKFDPKHVEEQHADLASLRKTSMDALEHPDRAKFRKRMEWLMAADKVTDEIVEVRYHLWSRPDTNRALKEYYEHLFDPSCEGYLFDEAQMSRITRPTLVLWTDRNPLHGVDAARRLNQLIKGSQLYVIKNAAHWPQWEQPEEHDRVVMDFLGK
ncbi:MAG TPA: alpha/beta hydrolase [Burkholderiales bacterium]|nr:alpha/beta hydrolase [Burkholderiales bacterium]